jgi:hypothetical protein
MLLARGERPGADDGPGGSRCEPQGGAAGSDAEQDAGEARVVGLRSEGWLPYAHVLTKVPPGSEPRVHGGSPTGGEADSAFGSTDGARGHVHVHGVSVRGLRASRVTRVVARAVVGAMLFGVWPWEALASPAAPAAAEGLEEQAPPSQPPANRVLPKFEAPAAMPQFSDPPTDRELFRARVFDEPLVPSGATSPEANAALGKALRSYLAESTREQVRALEEFLEDQPSSPWRVSVLANLAIVGRRTGFFSRTLEYGEKAWLEGRESTVPAVRALAARALAERAELLARLGRVDDVRALLAEVEGAEFSGSAHEKFDQVKQSLWMMENRPAESYRCGPLAVGGAAADGAWAAGRADRGDAVDVSGDVAAADEGTGENCGATPAGRAEPGAMLFAGRCGSVTRLGGW